MAHIFPNKVRHIWIASFPRSGNTFTRILFSEVLKIPTWSIYHTSEDTFEDYSSEVSSTERMPGDWKSRICQEKDLPLALIKTHEIPEDDAPAIYLLRDGMLATDSWFHYQKKNDPDLTLSEVIAGACQFGTWASHLKHWNPKTRPNTLIIRFEDLVQFPVQELTKIADFCGINLQDIHQGNIPTFQELQNKNPEFFRSGSVQGIPNGWGPDEVDAFVNIQGDQLRAFGYHCPPPSTVWSQNMTIISKSAERHAVESVRLLNELGSLWNKHQKVSNTLEKSVVPSDEMSLRRLVDTGLDVSVVFDIGASNSCWSRMMTAFLPNAKFHLFEPQAEIRDDYKGGLQQFLQLHPSAVLHPFALGDCDETLVLASDAKGVGATTLPIESESPEWKRYTVPVRTLCNLIDEGLPLPTVIKIDTQGSELKILQGMGDHLDQVSVLLLETWLVRSYEGKTPLLHELIGWLAGKGFYPWEFGPSYRADGLLVAPDIIFLNARCPLSPLYSHCDELLKKHVVSDMPIALEAGTMMNKDLSSMINPLMVRLEALEKRNKEYRDEIRALKSSAAFKIERSVRKRLGMMRKGW
jgi:FkbM family methyltransferase